MGVVARAWLRMRRGTPWWRAALAAMVAARYLLVSWLMLIRSCIVAVLSE